MGRGFREILSRRELLTITIEVSHSFFLARTTTLRDRQNSSFCTTKGAAGWMEENQIKETLQRILESLERIEVILQNRDDPVGFAESLKKAMHDTLREASSYTSQEG